MARGPHQVLEGLTPKPGLRRGDQSSLTRSPRPRSQTGIQHKRRPAPLGRRSSPTERGHPARRPLTTHYYTVTTPGQCPRDPQPQRNCEGTRPPGGKASKPLKEHIASRRLFPETTATVLFGEHKPRHRQTQNFSRVTRSHFLEFQRKKPKFMKEHMNDFPFSLIPLPNKC